MSLYEFFIHDATPTKNHTLSLHDALPIFDQPGTTVTAASLFVVLASGAQRDAAPRERWCRSPYLRPPIDRKSTRLNSSHRTISYAVFCLKKKIKNGVTNQKTE